MHRVARDCTFPISKPFSLPRLARRCRVLRPRWCQSGVNWCLKRVGVDGKGYYRSPKTAINSCENTPLSTAKAVPAAC